MNDDYDNAKADKAILEKLTMDQDGECDYPECDDLPEMQSGLCPFHTLLQRRARGEDIPERALEIAFENPNDVTSAGALTKAKMEGGHCSGCNGKAHEPAEHADFEALFDGTITVVTPLTDEAADWMKENVAFEPWQAVGKGIACDHRAADHLLAGILDEGFAVRKG